MTQILVTFCVKQPETTVSLCTFEMVFFVVVVVFSSLQCCSFGTPPLAIRIHRLLESAGNLGLIDKMAYYV